MAGSSPSVNQQLHSQRGATTLSLVARQNPGHRFAGDEAAVPTRREEPLIQDSLASSVGRTECARKICRRRAG